MPGFHRVQHPAAESAYDGLSVAVAYQWYRYWKEDQTAILNGYGSLDLCVTADSSSDGVVVEVQARFRILLHILWPLASSTSRVVVLMGWLH